MVRHIDLKEVLNRTGAVKDNTDKAKWRTCQGVISVTGQKFINWSDGKEKSVVGADLRGTTTKQWRGMAIGSRKDLGCF